MPLNGFTSLCSKNAKQIVSRDKGNPQYHKANNVSNSEVTHYQIDGKVIKTGDRCDYLLMNETSKTAYLIFPIRTGMYFLCFTFIRNNSVLQLIFH